MATVNPNSLIYQLMKIHFLDDSESDQNTKRILMLDVAYRELKLGTEITPETEKMSTPDLLKLIYQTNNALKLFGYDQYTYNPLKYIK